MAERREIVQEGEAVRCPRCRAEIAGLRRVGKVIRVGGVQVLSYICPHCHKKIHWGVRC